MSALDRLLKRTRNRSLELMMLQFLVVVILPNNDVGTAALPAVSAKAVRGAQGSRSVAPVKDNPPPRVARRLRLRPQLIAGLDSAVYQSAPTRSTVLLLTQRLRL